METMRYRAVLEGVETERPIQSLGNALPELGRWAKEILDRYPTGRVVFYETKEVFHHSVCKATPTDAVETVYRVTE